MATFEFYRVSLNDYREPVATYSDLAVFGGVLPDVGDCIASLPTPGPVKLVQRIFVPEATPPRVVIIVEDDRPEKAFFAVGVMTAQGGRS